LLKSAAFLEFKRKRAELHRPFFLYEAANGFTMELCFGFPQEEVRAGWNFQFISLIAPVKAAVRYNFFVRQV